VIFIHIILGYIDHNIAYASRPHMPRTLWCSFHICKITIVVFLSIYHYRLIFGFLSWYPKFWFGKILADLNPIYKIPKLHISSAHLTNFRSSQISPSGHDIYNWYLAKYWRFVYALCKSEVLISFFWWWIETATLAHSYFRRGKLAESQHVVVCRRLDQDRYLP
jgi:hypothetical protein